MKKNVIQVRLSDSEHDAVKGESGKRGLSMSAFLRQCAMLLINKKIK